MGKKREWVLAILVVILVLWCATVDARVATVVAVTAIIAVLIKWLCCCRKQEKKPRAKKKR